MSTRKRPTRLYIVTRSNEAPEDTDSVIAEARDRETAKTLSHPELGGDKDQYIVEPLPSPIGINRVVWKGAKS